MIFTKREKRTALVMAAFGTAVLAFYYLALPLRNRWMTLGDELKPRIQYMERLRARAESQNALLARRDELARKLGTLDGSETQPAAGANPAPGPSAPPGGPAKASANSAAPQQPGKAAATHQTPRKDAPRPPALTTYVERQANSAGIRLNNMVLANPAHCCKDGRAFAPVGLQTSMETTTPALIKLLHALEKGGRLVRVEQMDIRRDIKKGQNMTVTLYLVGYEPSGK